MDASYHSEQSHDQRIASYLISENQRNFYWNYRMMGWPPRDACRYAIEDDADSRPFAQSWGYVR